MTVNYHPAFEQYNKIYPIFTRLLRTFTMRKIIASLFMISSLIASATSFAGPKVEFKTTMGNFVVELDSVKAPKTTANFLNYVNSGFYNGTIFHRVIDGFMIQGGGFTPDLVQKPTNAQVVSEAQNGLKNDAYTISMARTSDPDSATAQFFINVKDNEGLNYPNAMGNGYTVFGKVISGTQTIDAIRKIPTMVAPAPKMGRMSDVPSKTVTIESATVLK
jgi:peptidyl-prolyl cis-trans isomerase A (cyclophilin A)